MLSFIDDDTKGEQEYLFHACEVFVLVLALSSLILNSDCLANPPTVKYSLNDVEQAIEGYMQDSAYIYNEVGSPTVSLATLDWPPYIGEKLCNKGWVFQFAVALLASRGYRIKIQFYPWARAVKSVELGKVDILFPEYFIEDSAPSDHLSQKRKELLGLSNKFPGGSIGFVKRKGTTDNFFGNLDNLREENIGVVRGYQNTPDFDVMMDKGEFKITEAVDDLHLVKLLMANRVNLILGDPKVLRFAVDYSDLSDEQKEEYFLMMEDVVPELQYNSLYFAVSRKVENWSEILKNLNVALDEFKKSGETQRIIRRASRECH